MSIRQNRGLRSKSSWWWVQTCITLTTFAGLAWWLAIFVRAATDEASILAVELYDSGTTQTTMQPLVPFASGKGNGNPIETKTISLAIGDSIRLQAITSPETGQMAAATRRQMHWMVLRQDNNNLWRNVCKRVGGGDIRLFSHQFVKPGKYLVAVALPPVVLDQLDHKDTGYITAFLTGQATERCKLMQVMIPYPSPGTTPDRKGHEAVDDMRSSRDLSTKQKGVELADDPHRAASVPQVPLRKDAQLPTFENTRKLRMEGVLPAIDVRYSPEQLAALEVDEWLALSREYSMPFIAVPNREFRSEFRKWPILLPNGERRDMEPCEIRSTYGLQILPLHEFSQSLQEQVREEFGDPATYFKCAAYRGFLLSDVLLQAVHESLIRSKIGISDVDKVEKIIVSLVVERSASDGVGRLRIVTRDVNLRR